MVHTNGRMFAWISKCVDKVDERLNVLLQRWQVCAFVRVKNDDLFEGPRKSVSNEDLEQVDETIEQGDDEVEKLLEVNVDWSLLNCLHTLILSWLVNR